MSCIREKSIWLTHTRFLLCRSFIHRASDRGRAVSLSLRRWSEDLLECRRIRFLGSVLTWPLALFFTDGSITSFSQIFLFHNGNPVLRSIIRLSFLCSSIELILICVPLMLFMLTAIRSFYVFSLFWLIKLISEFVNIVTRCTRLPDWASVRSTGVRRRFLAPMSWSPWWDGCPLEPCRRPAQCCVWRAGTSTRVCRKHCKNYFNVSCLAMLRFTASSFLCSELGFMRWRMVCI
jgi:hypothetical protein